MITIRSSKHVSKPTLIGFEATLTTASDVYEFSSNGPMVDPPSPFSGGLFGRIAWPRSRFRVSQNMAIEQQMFVSDEASDIAISWELRGSLAPNDLVVRPYFAACAPRGYRDLGFHFESEQEGGRLAWLPDVRGPKIIADTNGHYIDEPLRSAEEVAHRQGEGLVAPGRFEFKLGPHPSVLIFSTHGDARTQRRQQIGAFLAGLLENEMRTGATIGQKLPGQTIAHSVAA